MKLFLRLGFALCLGLCLSCASLSTTQVASVNSYAALLQENAAYPRGIVREFISLKYDIEQLNAGAVSPALVNEKLWNSYNGKSEALKKSYRANVGLNVLADYAAALNRLSGPNLFKTLQEPALSTGKNLDKLLREYDTLFDQKIPVGIGNLMAQGLLAGTAIGIKNRQAKELKRYVDEGDTLVSVLTQAVAHELDSLVVTLWLPALKLDLKTNQEELLKNLNPKGDYTVYYATQVDKEVAALIGRIDNLEQLTHKTITALGKIRAAHKELMQNLTKRKTIKEVLAQTQELAESTRQVYLAYADIKK
ncbi:MAG: hypothetical protein PHC61_01610 [Chitinivibrionales bacterium]|nr:hypothetical protein [Chitinivibrionales bacterium]